jgi:phosphoglycolate phosphatase-like HAD superfamily hydrolase
MIIFDLDGTLCDDTHRRHHLAAGDFAAYHTALPTDKPKFPLLATMRALHTAGNHIEIWSGRYESSRKATLHWFAKYAIWVVDRSIVIRLRPEGDERSSAVLKEAWLDEALKFSAPAVTLAFDDLQSAVDMWRRRGIICAQVEANANDYNKG